MYDSVSIGIGICLLFVTILYLSTFCRLLSIISFCHTNTNVTIFTFCRLLVTILHFAHHFVFSTYILSTL